MRELWRKAGFYWPPLRVVASEAMVVFLLLAVVYLPIVLLFLLVVFMKQMV